MFLPERADMHKIASDRQTVGDALLDFNFSNARSTSAVEHVLLNRGDYERLLAAAANLATYGWEASEALGLKEKNIGCLDQEKTTITENIKLLSEQSSSAEARAQEAEVRAEELQSETVSKKAFVNASSMGIKEASQKVASLLGQIECIAMVGASPFENTLHDAGLAVESLNGLAKGLDDEFAEPAFEESDATPR